MPNQYIVLAVLAVLAMAACSSSKEEVDQPQQPRSEVAAYPGCEPNPDKPAEVVEKGDTLEGFEPAVREIFSEDGVYIGRADLKPAEGREGSVVVTITRREDDPVRRVFQQERPQNSSGIEPAIAVECTDVLEVPVRVDVELTDGAGETAQDAAEETMYIRPDGSAFLLTSFGTPEVPEDFQPTFPLCEHADGESCYDEPELQVTYQVTYEKETPSTQSFTFEHRLAWRAEFSQGSEPDDVVGQEEDLVASSEIGMSSQDEEL